MNLVRIPTSNIDDVWNLVKKDIQEALSYSGNHTDSDFVLETLKQQKFQLWIVWDKEKKTTKDKYYGVVITEVIKRKLRKSCNIFVVTGKHRQKWQHLISVLEDFALEQECNNMELIARKGWERIMEQFNYKKTHVVLEKSITKKENN
nr:putative acetyltransferase [uncultured Mediterranean phage uvMED]|tara:strand:+ start:254 stop:697 length:444 start_codon:yes stop_codon:yes gene_type:complete